jgi:NHL repeat
MRPSRVADLVAGRTRTRIVGDRWGRGRGRPARVARGACAVGALTLPLGVATAGAALLRQVSSFGGGGSGAGQFQTPVGVAIQQSNGAVYVADSGNARVEKFDANGNFIAAWGWGVKDGTVQSEVCTSNCLAGIAGSGPGQFSRPTSIAVGASGSPSAGKVFVGDAGNNVVLKFDADGNFLSSIDGSTTPQGKYSSLAGVAVDQSGNLWTADGSTDNIDKFSPSGKFLKQWNDTFGKTLAIAVDSTHKAVYLIRGAQTTERFTLTGKGETVIDNGTGVALGLDQQTGNLYVDHGGDVAIYNRNATQVDSLTLATTNAQGLAFRSSGGTKFGQNDLYVSDASRNNVTIYGPPPAGAPLLASASATQTAQTTATLDATIVPLGFDTTCTFEVVDDADFQATGYTTATTVPCTPADLGASFTFQQASADVSGLTVGATYHFQVVVTNSAGTTTGADQTFQMVNDWAPFTRCPVDDPAMLTTDGGVTSLAICLASNSTHGSITIGTTTTATGNSNLQDGLMLNESNSVFTVIAPPGGSLIADPAQVTAGGVTVTATVESAGVPSNFNFIARIETGVPIITIPIKIHLVGQTVDLGPSCFIGSDQTPIFLNAENTDLSNASAKFETFDPDGTPDPNGPLETIVVSGVVQGDDTFAVPGATGCGPNGDGSLDAVINAVVGLPSPAGANHLVLDDASSALAVAIDGENGQQFANDWHSAFDTTTTTSTTTTTTTAPPTTTTTTSSTTTTTMASPSSAFVK